MARLWKEKTILTAGLLLCYLYGNAAYSIQECYTCPTGAMSVAISCPVGAIQVEWVAVAAKPLTTGCANDSGISYDCSSRCCTLNAGTDCIKNDTSLMHIYGFCNGMANCSSLVVFDSMTCAEPSLYPAVSSLIIISYNCDYSDPSCIDPAPINGKANTTGTSVGSTATLSCDTGYRLIGDSLVTCTASGWSGSAECSTKDCGDPTPINGRSDHTGTTFGHTAMLSCDVGYTLSGHTSVTCTDTGWSGSAQCTIKDCGDPTPINGTSDHTGTTFGHTAMLSCDVGYTLSGHSSVTCTETGWSGSAQCTIKDCGDPTPINGTSDHTGTTFGDTAMLSCDVGYTLSGHTSVTCTETGWSGSAQCTIKDCGDPTPINGTSDHTGTTFGDTAMLSCDVGYTLSGHTSVTCTETGWSGSAQCTIKDCGDPTPANGASTHTGTSYGHTVTLSCDVGYTLSGYDVVTCTDNGWDGSAECLTTDCGQLMVSHAASVTYPVGTSYRGVALVTCQQDYQLIGHGFAVCQTNREWSNAPICGVSSAECIVPSVPGATLTGLVFTVGSVVGVSCNTGYHLQGASSITCQTDGSWTELPTCVVQDCGNLDVRHASITYPVGRTYKGVALVTCFQGYQLIGHGVAICQNTGRWTDTPTCVAISPTADTQTSDEDHSDAKGVGAAGLVLAIILPIAIISGLVIFFCCYKKRIYNWLKEELDLFPINHPEPTLIPPPVLRQNVNKKDPSSNAPLDPRLPEKSNASSLTTTMNGGCALKMEDESLDQLEDAKSADIPKPKRKRRKNKREKRMIQGDENETDGIQISVDSEKAGSVDSLSSNSRNSAPLTAVAITRPGMSIPTSQQDGDTYTSYKPATTNTSGHSLSKTQQEADSMSGSHRGDNSSFSRSLDMNITSISRISDNNYKEETNFVDSATRVDAPINDDSPRSHNGSINQNSVSSRLSIKSPPPFIDRYPAATINGMETIAMPESFRIQHSNDDDDSKVMSKTSKSSLGSIKSFLSSRGSGSKYAVPTDDFEDGTLAGRFEFKPGVVIKRDK